MAGSGANPADAADFGGTLPSGSGTFAAGETIKTITVLASGDTAVEPGETFTLTLTAAGLNTVTSTGTISNDDAPEQLWRTASANTIGQAQASSGNRKQHAFRIEMPIGSGDRDRLRIAFFNWFSNSGNDAIFNTPLVVDEMYVCFNGVAVRVQKDGNGIINIPVVSQGGGLYRSDEMLPSAFGVTVFPRGALVELRGLVTREAATGFSAGQVPATQTRESGTNAAKIQFAWVDIDGSATGTPQTITNIATPGAAFTASTGTLGAAGSGYTPILEGRFAPGVGDPPTMLIYGDSNDMGLSQIAGATGSILGIGRNAMALHDGTGADFTAYLSVAVGGSSVTQFFGTGKEITHQFFEMASVAMGAFATNNFSTTGTSISAADFVTAMRTYWAKLREKGVKKILQLGVQTRGTSTDAWVTEANQTIAAGWLAGGNVEQYYGMLPAEIAAGRVDGFLNYQSWRGTDPNKWKIDPVEGKGTSDSTHPLGWVHRDEAVEIRAKLTSMGMKA